jgi:hypothetical protein
MAKGKASVRDRVIRAKRIRTRSGLNWTAFTQPWAAFNHLYAQHRGDTERDWVMNFIRDHLNEVSADRVLDAAATPIDQLLELPPGDMRLNVDEDRFRARSRRHAAIVRDATQGAIERVAHLAAVLYQVRCNLLHGDKDPISTRDRRLVRACAQILDELLPELEASILT